MINRRVALVIGATWPTGFGYGVADELAKLGWLVFGTSRGQRNDRPGVTMLIMDVTDALSVRACVQSLLARTGGRLDLAVYCAGVGAQNGFAVEFSAEQMLAMLDVNCVGLHRVIREVEPVMRKQKRGTIIAIGSITGTIGTIGRALYSAAKGALHRYLEAVAFELWLVGINLILVEPGKFATGFGDRKIKAAEHNHAYDSMRPQFGGADDYGGDPRQVVRQIIRIARARRPHFYYCVGHSARIFRLLKRLIPDAIFRWGMKIFMQRKVRVSQYRRRVAQRRVQAQP